MSQTFAKKSVAMFRQTVIIIAAVLGAASFLVFKIYQKIYLYADIVIHKIKTACGCTQMSQLVSMHPLIFAALAALGAVILVFLSYAIYRLVKLKRQTKKFTAQYLLRAKPRHSAKLAAMIANLRLDKSRIMEIREAKPVVFCFGLWQPRICIAGSLVKMLQPDELEAVLLHEYHHMISREPMKLFIIKYWQSVFGWLPGTKAWVKKYITLSEIAADEQATDNFTERNKLARALFKITEIEEKHLLRANLALPFFSALITERVNRLCDDSYVPQFKLGGRGFVFGLGAVVFGLLTLFVFLSDSGQALAMHDNGNCVSHNSASQSPPLICAAANHSHQPVSECSQH